MENPNFLYTDSEGRKIYGTENQKTPEEIAQLLEDQNKRDWEYAQKIKPPKKEKN